MANMTRQKSRERNSPACVIHFLTLTEVKTVRVSECVALGPESVMPLESQKQVGGVDNCF